MRTLTAIVGWPVARSPSPAMHNAAFRGTGLDWTYERLATAPGRARDAVALLRDLGARGANVTIPHKVDVIEFLDDVVGDAAATGSVNTIVFEDRGRAVGHSTDGEGFLRSLPEPPAGKTVTILGAGGAARAVAYALARAGAARVVVCARRLDQARALKNLHPAIDAGAWQSPPDADLAVNTTPLREGLPPVRGKTAVDLIYLPPPTGFGTGGLGMLVHQAGLSFELWTNRPAPIETMEAAARASLSS